VSGHPDPERLLRPDPEAAVHLAACARCRIELRLWQDQPDEEPGPAGLRLLTALGEGPNGVVHLAVGPRGERLAVKRGARAPVGVPEHPNLGRARVVDGWLATEHVAGSPFDAGAFPASAEGAARLAGALLQAASALRRLHEGGLVHGNLRASNALVEPSGRVVLVDLAGTGRAGDDWHALAGLAERANARIGSAGLDEVAGLLRSDPGAATARLHQLVGAELRYVDLGEIGSGGMGEVRRVQDLLLGRIVARKVLRTGRVDGDALARFRREAELTAQLQHPGIVPVYDVGLLADGRPFYTMREVAGRTLADAIASVEPGGVPRALVDVFARICDAVGYAHARGVVHGDLKPANVLLGDFGEVLVVDWGLSALVDADGGAVAGTPAYLSPERARGERVASPAADVWALGAVLYEILSGRPAYLGATASEVLDRVAAGPPPALDPSLPDDLVALCGAAMAREPADRPPHAGALAASVREWLEGARRRDRALALVAAADEELRVAAQSREAARSHREAAAAALDGVKPHDPVSRKEPAWALEDAADEDERRAAAAEVTAVERLRAALAEVPGLEPARERLADHFAALHRAEADPRRAAALEEAVRRHGTARHARWLAGDGLLSLETDPPGAPVRAERIEERGRRLVVVGERDLGATPVREAALAPGSWILRVGAPDRLEVRLPVRILRGEPWSLRRPGEDGAYAIRLPERLDPDEVFVAGGWFASGGDRAAPNGLPGRAVWVEPFVMRRHPVTNAEYLAFLDDLVACGREDEALRHAPRERAASGGAGALIYQRRPDGGFALGPDADGDVWEPDWPVVSVPLDAATAYAGWLSARTGHLRWRLPFELEWEKAARGADGRAFPWGNHVDPTWCCTRDSHGGRPRLARIGDFPTDESPYGIRGLGGNVRDRCLDLYRGGPVVDERGVAVTEWRHGSGSRVLRGGSWGDSPAMARSAERSGVDPALRGGRIGFRLVRPVASGA
jgi:serine/threonine protein kinase/formylglycine-generating enzyme required for sulfatase activity